MGDEIRYRLRNDMATSTELYATKYRTNQHTFFTHFSLILTHSLKKLTFFITYRSN